MKRIVTNVLAVAGLVFTAAFTLIPRPAGAQAPAPKERAVDLTICLDTSGSMQGLIEAAKQKIWVIVNDLALAKPTPKLRVALITYGNNGHPAAEGWVFVQTGFTEDLDLVSQKLFALTTNGGTEYVGRVLQAALDRLDWTRSPGALKLIVVAGNESADQDQQVHYQDMCRAAIAREILVDSIYCGNPSDPIAPGWREVATLADGRFACIDHDNGTVAISSPFDDQLAALSASLNTTYVPFGAKGRDGLANQTLQDQNAQRANSAAAAGRAGTKANGLYQCSWDLIDACRTNAVKLEDIKEADLPESLRKMSVEERKKYVDEMQKKRSQIQQQIAEMHEQREKFVTDEMKKTSRDETRSFDHAVRQAVRAQAEAKGFRFEEKKAGN